MFLAMFESAANNDPVWRRAIMDLEERMRNERQAGIEQGSRESMIRLFLKEKLSLADCAQECGMSEEEFLAAAEEYRRKLKEE